jgi:integration host factor subunit beta
MLRKPVEINSTGFFLPFICYNRISYKGDAQMAEQKVTKNDLIDSIYKSADLEKKDIAKVIDSFLSNVREALEQGSTIELRGFGTFEPRLRKGRSLARNPRTGEKLSVEPHYVAAFRAGQQLKNALWNLHIENEK